MTGYKRRASTRIGATKGTWSVLSIGLSSFNDLPESAAWAAFLGAPWGSSLLRGGVLMACKPIDRVKLDLPHPFLLFKLEAEA